MRDPRKRRPTTNNRRELFFYGKLHEALNQLDEMRRVLTELGNKLDGAKLDEAVDVEAEVDQIEELIWRYNNAVESALDAWLHDDLSRESSSRLNEMHTPASLGLPRFTDEDQAARALRQASQVAQRSRERDAAMDRLVVGLQWTETAANWTTIALGVGLLGMAVKQGGKWVFIKALAVGTAAYLAEQAAEKGLRAAGASEQTIRGIKLAALVVTLVILRRRSSSTDIKPPVVPIRPVGRGIWDLTPEARWTTVEQRLGKNLVVNFKTIDKFASETATSIKSLDLQAKTYLDLSTLRRVVTGYIDKVAAYKGGRWNKITIDPEQIQHRALDLAVPPDGTEEQKSVLQSLVDYGRQHGINVNIVEMW